MITCLGLTFPDDDARREHFRNELRKHLPELKKLEGFPIGEDEDILALSDPPYYTACPNPWLDDFIAEWEAAKAGIPGRMPDFDVLMPYAADVSEGKNNPIYNAHSYHTKVPHPAIMRYILHYTQPGDIVLDGFAGTGMTGVAAQLCGSPDAATKYMIERERRDLGLAAPVWGARRAICGDLSPIASFIAYNYNTPVEVESFEQEARRILAEVETEYGWMYETEHILKNGIKAKGEINYTVWSEIMNCPNCGEEFFFTEKFFNEDDNTVSKKANCSKCEIVLTKESSNLVFESIVDPFTNEVIKRPKRKPYFINYTYAGNKFEKKLDKQDLDVLEKISLDMSAQEIPSFKMPDIQMTKVGRVKTTNITHIHHFFLPRALKSLFIFWSKAKTIENLRVRQLYLFTIEQIVWGISLLNRYRPSGYSQVNQYMSGVFYVASHTSEISPNYMLQGKVDRLIKAFSTYKFNSDNVALFVGDCASIKLSKASVDYIFTDPPFGENIYYSDLNILIEAWHRVLTNPISEAIVDKAKNKTLLDYQQAMETCFSKYFQLLKPGKWITIEFSNTSAAVWNGIQMAVQKVGFIIANVSALDKQQGSFQSVTSPTAVKQDLVISCYKPSEQFEAAFSQHQGDVAVWDFVREHLHHLPIHAAREGHTAGIIERDPRILYDRLITFYLMRGLPVPMDSSDFRAGLRQRFTETDGQYFLPEQAQEYEQKKALTSGVVQASLFIGTENEGIAWLREVLKKPQTRADLHPLWMQAITAIRKGDVLPDLSDLLNENFIQLTNGAWRVPDLNEAKDREVLRTKSLLKEFARYEAELQAGKTKRLKEVRSEALHAGFRDCWERKDFATIVLVGDRIPANLLLEDEKLLMYYDIAKDRV